MPTLENIESAQQVIEQTLAEFKQLFSEVYFRKVAKQLKSIPPADAEQIFNDLWNQMEVGALSESKEALDYYFATIKSETIQLKEHQKKAPPSSASPLAKSCDALSLRLQWLHRCGMTEMFIQMISIYHWLAAQQLFIRQIKDYQSMLDELNKANVELQKKQNYIDVVCQGFLALMKKKGHLLTHAEWNMSEKFPLIAIHENSQEYMDEIEKKLSRIPSSSKINKLFKRVTEEKLIGDDGRLDARVKSRYLLNIVQDVKGLSSQLLHGYKESSCHQFTLTSNVELSKLARFSDNISAATFQATSVDSDIQALSKTCDEKGDKETSEKIVKWMDVRARLTAFQTDCAHSYMDQFDAHKKMLTGLVEKIQLEKIRQQHLQQKIVTAEKLFETTINSLCDLAQQYDIISKTKREETFEYFLERNWLTIITVGLLFAGIGVGGGVFLALGALFVVIIAAAGLILGAGLGLAGGMLAETVTEQLEVTDKVVDEWIGRDNILKSQNKKPSREEQVQDVLESSVAHDAEELTEKKTVTAEKSKLSGSGFAFFPSLKPIKQAAQISAPQPSNYEKLVMVRAL